MIVDEIRNRVLCARETRASLRGRLSQSGNASISLSLNIPGYPKTTPLISDFFGDVLADCKRFLQSHRVAINTALELRQADEAGDFYLAPISDRRAPGAIKSITEGFEMLHPLGRLIDIDITDRQNQPVTSGRLKQCLLCAKPALVCMRESNHEYEALREKITGEVHRFLTGKTEQQTCRQLAGLALRAILYEISASPKPGLVGRFEQGAHHDMDYFTFLDSTSALAGFFEELALAGWRFDGNDLIEALPVVRAIGLKMEAAMFAATDGVNTQKGLIFLIGLALFSSARCIAGDGLYSAGRCREIIAAICAGLVQNELATGAADERTHGALCYQRYGSEGAGARKEAECGLPCVFEKGLPELVPALAGIDKRAAAAQKNRALVKTLLRLMTETADSNILYRKDMQTLRNVRQMAQRVLDAADEEVEAERHKALLQYCQHEQISPGGSADLLAVTVFLYFVERAFSNPCKYGGLNQAAHSCSKKEP